jgi:hypothetical protein
MSGKLGIFGNFLKYLQSKEIIRQTTGVKKTWELIK